MHDGSAVDTTNQQKAPEGAVPTYLLEREGTNKTKILSNMVKQKRKEKAGRW